MFGQQVGPVLDRLQVPRIAGELVGRQNARADLCAHVQLDEPVGVRLLVGFPLDRATDEEPWPGMIGRSLAAVEHVVGRKRDQPDRACIARVAVIPDEAGKQARRPLADVAVVPIGQLRVHLNCPVGLDVPMAIEDEVGSLHDGHGGTSPRITFEGFGCDPHAEIALAILPTIPRRDHAVAVLDRGVGKVFLAGERFQPARRRPQIPSP